MTACDFDVHLRVIASDGTTEVGDLNDPDNGIILMAPVVLPEDNARRTRYKVPYAHGDFTTGPPVDEPGELLVVVDVEAATWGAVQTAWDEVRGWLRAEWDFFIEYEVEGVTKRWRTERPDITPQSQTAADVKSKRLSYEVRFTVQPNPVVTVA